MVPTTTWPAPAATLDSASEPPNCPTWIWFASRAALVCAPPLIDFMSTYRPLSLKMPCSNAYHITQLSAVMLLYAAITFVQHARFVADAAGDAPGVCDVPEGAPPHAMARMAAIATPSASLTRILFL